MKNSASVETFDVVRVLASPLHPAMAMTAIGTAQTLLLLRVELSVLPSSRRRS